MKISLDKWKETQSHEMPLHEVTPLEVDIHHYKNAYTKYFSYLNLNFDLEQKSIIEIGPARIPSLYFCKNYRNSFIIEPLIFSSAESLMSKMKNITFIREPAELCDFPKADEAILLNLLQHVIDPIEIINRCKENVKVIRFFEPIDTVYDRCHPHAFNLDFFKNQFGENNVKFYSGGSGGQGFHTQNCAYGVYAN